MVKAHMQYSRARKEWVAVISDGDIVLDIGCEASRRDAETWARHALEAYTDAPGPHTIPDMYDRRTVN